MRLLRAGFKVVHDPNRAALDVFGREAYEPADSNSDLQNIAFAETGDFARMDLLNPEGLC